MTHQTEVIELINRCSLYGCTKTHGKFLRVAWPPPTNENPSVEPPGTNRSYNTPPPIVRARKEEPYRIGRGIRRAGPPAAAEDVGEVPEGDALAGPRHRLLGAPRAGVLRHGRRRGAAPCCPARHCGRAVRWSGRVESVPKFWTAAV